MIYGIYEVRVVIDSPVMEKIDTVEHRLFSSSEEKAKETVNELLKDDGFKVFTTLYVDRAKLLSQEEQDKWLELNGADLFVPIKH